MGMIIAIAVGVAAGWREVTMADQSVTLCTSRELAIRVGKGEWELTPQAEADVQEISREILQYNQH